MRKPQIRLNTSGKPTVWRMGTGWACQFRFTPFFMPIGFGLTPEIAHSNMMKGLKHHYDIESFDGGPMAPAIAPPRNPI